MIIDFLLLALGITILMLGANWLVDGASSVASRFGVTPLIIGLTVVAFGTSLPELVVNIMAALKGSSGLAIGNVLGSNVANTLLIVGVAALIKPIRVQSSTVRVEIPLSLLAAIILLVLANDSFIDGTASSAILRSDGIILLILFVVFLCYTFSFNNNHFKSEEVNIKKHRTSITVLLITVGLGGLYGGGHLIVEAAISIAQTLGVSDTVIGLTILAIGTSLPELATTIVAAYKGQSDIAIGNVVGSNIFNILMVFGITASISPMPFDPSDNIHLLVVIASSLMLLIFALVGSCRCINRYEGGGFVLIYLLYLLYIAIWI